ncbi:hypothetical protein IE53DRAFT_387020 [Violaceomyces palustris]|uniref:Uncharacterized protein n=1 Tax=Violaceomyces palustris TaxID=1673888 RepID=A0ACD0NXV0_9BASI|nr:hypothetical protein IE53DRAFT_387020 [Violaceomyces palustris]
MFNKKQDKGPIALPVDQDEEQQSLPPYSEDHAQRRPPPWHSSSTPSESQTFLSRLKSHRLLKPSYLLAFSAVLILFYFLALGGGTGMGGGSRDGGDHLHYGPPPDLPNDVVSSQELESWSDPVTLSPPPFPGKVLKSEIANLEFEDLDVGFFVNAWGRHGGSVLIVKKGEKVKGVKDCDDDRIVCVQVEARYTLEELKDSVLVAKVKREDGMVGLLISAPNHYPEGRAPLHELLEYHVTVHLPSTSASSEKQTPYLLPRLETRTHNFAIEAHDLSPSVRFENLEMNNLNGAISVGSIDSSKSILISNSNGKILTGGRMTSESIRLETKNGSIRTKGEILADKIRIVSENGSIQTDAIVKVEEEEGESKLSSDNGSVSIEEIQSRGSLEVSSRNGKISGTFKVSGGDRLNLSNGNGAIQAKVEILPASSPTESSSVQVDAKSRSGSIQIDYESQPEDVSLHSDVETGMGSVTVTMAKGFRGKWYAKTQVGSIQIQPPRQRSQWLVESDRRDVVGRETYGRLGTPSSNFGQSSIKVVTGSIRQYF